MRRNFALEDGFVRQVHNIQEAETMGQVACNTPILTHGIKIVHDVYIVFESW